MEQEKNTAMKFNQISGSGSLALEEISKSNAAYTNFLKMKGRLYKFPTTVALEFFAQRSDVVCIATKEQWSSLNYHIKDEETPIRFVDTNGTVKDYYDFSQLQNADFLPETWEITQENSADVKAYLRNNYNIADNNPNASIISMMLYVSNIGYDATKCMEKLNIPEEERNDFYRTYINAFSIITAGRLEMNAVRPFEITPDLSVMDKLKTNGEKLIFISDVSKTARDSLSVVEKAVNEYNEKRRVKENELRTVGKTDIGGETAHTTGGISYNSSDGVTPTESVLDGNNPQRADRGDSSTLQVGTDGGENNRLLDKQTELAESTDNGMVRTQSSGLHISADDTDRAINGGRADRSLRNTLDKVHGAESPDGNGVSEISAQVSDDGEKSRGDSEGISRLTGNGVRDEQPSSSNGQLRNAREVGGTEETDLTRIRNGGESTYSLYRGLTEQQIGELVQAAFNDALLKHKDKCKASDERVESLYNRLAKQVAIQHCERNVIKTAFNNFQPFTKFYGSIGRINVNYFGNQLDDIEKEIDESIRKKVAILRKKGSDIFTVDKYSIDNTEITEFGTNNHLVTIPLDNSISTDIDSRLKAKGIILTGQIITSNGVIDVAQADKRYAIQTDLKNFKLLSMWDTNSNTPIKSLPVADVMTNTELDALDNVITKVIDKQNATPDDSISINIRYSESGILSDLIEKNPNISFALANAVIEYLDEKQNAEREIDNAAWLHYHKTAFVISGIANGKKFSYESRIDIGDGKGFGGGSLIDHISEYKEISYLIPFLERNAVLTEEEQKIVADLKAENPIHHESDYLISIPQHDIEIQLNKVEEIVIEKKSLVYEGGTDEDGHERKDNYSEKTEETTYSVSYGELIEYESEYGVSPTDKETIVEQLTKALDDSVKNNDISVYIKHKDDRKEYINPKEIIAESKTEEETTEDTAIYDYKAENTEIVADAKIGDVLTVEMDGENMNLRIENITGNYSISMVRLDEEYSEITDAATIEFSDKWRDKLLDATKNALIVLHTAEEINSQLNTETKSIDADEWKYYIIADLKSWVVGGTERSPLEKYDTFEEVIARYNELREKDYNKETEINPNSSMPYTRLTLGVSGNKADFDILHVKADKNYFVSDFRNSRNEKYRENAELISLVKKLEYAVGFDGAYDIVDGNMIAVTYDEYKAKYQLDTAISEDEQAELDEMINSLPKKEVSEQRMLEQGDIIRIPENEMHTGTWYVAKMSDLSIEFENMDKTAMNSNFSIYDFGYHRDKLQEQLHFEFVSVPEEKTVEVAEEVQNENDTVADENDAVDIYTKYLAELPDTRYTRLNERSEINYRHHPPVTPPVDSIWGEVDHYFEINNGIYEVDTESHGGIMIKSDIARLILSPKAQLSAEVEDGWYHYEEDSNFAIAKRELIDKGLFKDLNEYFSLQYGHKTEDFFEHYNDVVNNSIKRWYMDYWNARESAIIGSLSVEEQAEKFGQMSFGDDTTTVSPVEKPVVQKFNIEEDTVSDGTYAVYQLNDENQDDLFVKLSVLEKTGKTPNINRYTMVYSGNLSEFNTDEKELLEDIFDKFNNNRPVDFTGHSLSVSDVVIIEKENEKTAYFCDTFGFEEVSNFFDNVQQNENSVSEEISETTVEHSDNNADETVIDVEYTPVNESTDVDNAENDSNAEKDTIDIKVEEDKKPKRYNSMKNRLYKAFTEQFPDITSGKHSYERYGNRYVEDGDNDAFEPLSVEHLYGNKYGFMYWYVQNGDLMRDPDFTFELNHEKRELTITEYQLDGSVPCYHNVFENGKPNTPLLNSLSENFLQILKTNKAIGRPLTAYTTADGEEITVDNEPNPSAIPSNREEYNPNTYSEVVEDNRSDEEIYNDAIATDISAEWREVLNDFSQKHNFGELNLYPPQSNYNYSWSVKEKLANETEEEILSFYYSEDVLSANTLKEKLNDFESNIRRTHRDMLVENIGGKVTPLPNATVLPTIEYADTPTSKYNDNISALKELRRLQEYEENGEPLYVEKKPSKYSREKTKEQSDEILRKFSGWGGLWQVLDERFKQHEGKRKQLRELLDEKEYTQAERTTLTAFYTPQVVVDAMHRAITNMELPTNAKILEPSCATGNFITRMPSRYRDAEIVGVEIDKTTSEIARFLTNNNPNITILNKGYEKTDFENNTFDLVIGNVPFGTNKLVDLEYDRDLLIHDSFIRKSIDKVKTGGVVAVITTSGTLDKKDSKIREMFAEKADLVGAIRLPNTTFGNVGVTTDIVFLQKRKTPLQPFDKKPDWCYVVPVDVERKGKKNEGTITAYVNSYFVQNPQMVLGTHELDYRNKVTCVPYENANLEKQLNDAITNINAKFNIEKLEKSIAEKSNKITAWGKNFTFQIKDNRLYYRDSNDMLDRTPTGKNAEKTLAMYKGLIDIRLAARELVEKQALDITDEELVPFRNKLNEVYDKFISDFKTYLSSLNDDADYSLSSPTVKKLFNDDADYSLLTGLENRVKVEVDGKTEEKIEKTDIFFKRTVNANMEITSVDTEEDALQVSLNQKGLINLPYMATLLMNKYPDNTIEEIADKVSETLIEKGELFVDPSKVIVGRKYSGIVDKAEYLSGNVRQKLAIAKDSAEREPEKYQRNVDALTSVVPTDIQAEDIAVRMGVSWIDESDYTEFLHQLSGRSENQRANHNVHYLGGSGRFSIENLGAKQNFNINETTTFGLNAEHNMYQIAETVLNQRRIKIFKKDEKGHNTKVTDKMATKTANKKAEQINEKFKEWIFADEQRKAKYVKRYNDLFNNIVCRKYDGSSLTFNGMNNIYELRPHQKDCIARALYGGNTLAAHCVGAGKSAVMFATVMKKRELGLIQKACMVVPKPLIQQTADSWHQWFPNAKLLTIDAQDLSNEKKRELFASKCTTGDYDAVIMSVEQFDKLKVTCEFEEEHYQRQIDELEEIKRRELRANNGAETKSIKDLEKAIQNYENKIRKINARRTAQRGHDNLLFFEELGFDYLVVDEAHNYKNGCFFTKMTNISGITPSDTGRSADMYLKTDYFNQTYGNGHILLATGTPVTNSMTELYVMTRYLRPDLLRMTDTHIFDNWAATFGTVVARDEMGLDGSFQIKTAFAKFTNLPELMSVYKTFADVQSAKKLNLPRPELKGGKPQIISVAATPEQKAYIQEMAKRARAISSSTTPIIRPNGKEDCFVLLSREALKLGLGNRMVKALYDRENVDGKHPLPTDFNVDAPSKVDACAKKVFEIYEEQNKLGNNKAVQIIFCDIAVHDGEGKWSAYKYLRDTLIGKGIKENEIIFAPKSDAEDKAEIFERINKGEHRVVIASTNTLGTGANIQQNLYALHHLDIPYRPSDFEQREGRILRQGNNNKEVEIINYVTEGTFDSMFYSMVLNKAKFIGQLLDDENPSRTCEDVNDIVLYLGHFVAVAEGKSEMKELFSEQQKQRELQMVAHTYKMETINLRNELPKMKEKLVTLESNLIGFKKDFANKPKEYAVTKPNAETLHETKDINKFLKEYIDNKYRNLNDNTAFSVGNFKVEYFVPKYNGAHPTFKITGEKMYTLELNMHDSNKEIDVSHNMRLRQFFETGLERRINDTVALIEDTNTNIRQVEERLDKPFPYENELKEVTEKVEELIATIYEGQDKEPVNEPMADYDNEVIEINPNYEETDENDFIPDNNNNNNNNYNGGSMTR